ncbi:MAG: hypothetical protein J6X94_13780 [Lachnospiraceae bacterium]|nr:hypothetical protein [Lachnospiraceae bacterium]
MNKRLKFLGLDVLYSIALVIVATVCSLIQCIGLKQVLSNDLIDYNYIDMKFNGFAYTIGFLIFAGFLFYSFKKFLKTKYEDYPIGHWSVVIIHFMISSVFCFVMFLALIFASLVIIGFNKNLVPELLAFITVFVWPIVSFVLMNAALMVFLIKGRKPKKLSVKTKKSKEK